MWLLEQLATLVFVFLLLFSEVSLAGKVECSIGRYSGMPFPNSNEPKKIRKGFFNVPELYTCMSRPIASKR